MKTPHIHAELIKAWADGAEIEELCGGEWLWTDPTWREGTKYRIKSDEKKPVVRWLWCSKRTKSLSALLMTEGEAKDMGWNVKLEWSRQEFSE